MYLSLYQFEDPRKLWGRVNAVLKLMKMSRLLSSMKPWFKNCRRRL